MKNLWRIRNSNGEWSFVVASSLGDAISIFNVENKSTRIVDKEIAAVEMYSRDIMGVN